MTNRTKADATLANPSTASATPTRPMPRGIACAARSVAILVCAAVTGCATPGERADAAAAAAGYARTVIAGQPFVHVVYMAPSRARGPAPAPAPGPPPADRQGPLWVFIEGDGVPWIGETLPASDPTPRTLVALAMMREAGRPAVYLGRPCYFGLSGTPPCTPLHWTHRRFAPEIVDSMAAALERIRAQHEWLGRPVVLAGFSGGGTLAALVAPHVPGLCALVTVASPLDIDEWARRRGYSALAGSLDPARQPGLRPEVRQLHLRGDADPVVAADNGAAYFARNPSAALRTVPGAGHGAEWARILAAQLGALPIDDACH